MRTWGSFTGFFLFLSRGFKRLIHSFLWPGRPGRRWPPQLLRPFLLSLSASLEQRSNWLCGTGGHEDTLAARMRMSSANVGMYFALQVLSGQGLIHRRLQVDDLPQPIALRVAATTYGILLLERRHGRVGCAVQGLTGNPSRQSVRRNGCRLSSY